MDDFEVKTLAGKISGIMGPDFCIADTSGKLIFPEKEENIPVPDEPSEGEFQTTVGRVFLFVKTEGDGLWFCDTVKPGESQAAARKTLELASIIYNENVLTASARRNDFFRTLLTGGRDAVNQNDFSLYTKRISAAGGDVEVLIVTVSSRRNGDGTERENRISDVCSLLEYVFPESDGCVTVKMKADTAAVIVPVGEANSPEDIAATAAGVRETAFSEYLTDISVGIGARVRQLRNADTSYRTAERALAVGESFGFEGGVYSYDKLGVARLLYGLKREVCEAYLREVFGTAFLEYHGKKVRADEKSGEKGGEAGDELIKTVKTYLELNQNVSETSKVLFVHRNTLNYRIDKFNKLTGLNCTSFEDGLKVSIGFMILDYMNSLPPERGEEVQQGAPRKPQSRR
ncbi:MAG: helix-turn-helix domain-containing protein [Clostridia bacterium]|nr:helix-turn-helix domain-containing protein [Clostridia bacterium]